MTRRLAGVLLVLLLAAGCAHGGAGGGGTSRALSSPVVTSSATASATASATGPSLTTSSGASTASTSPASGPRWRHVVVVVEENRDATSILGNPDAPYLNQLAHRGLNLTDMRAETHPSEPNYLALFSGSTHHVTDDSCPHTFAGANLGDQLRRAGYSFVGYSEGLPHAGYTGCTLGNYARRHSPWVSFADLPAAVNQPLSALPSDFDKLPTVAFVIPDLLHDMHDGTVSQADGWLHAHLSAYVAWARTHDSLLIVTWDENEGAPGNRIATFAVGDNVAASSWSARVDHYSLLRTIEDGYHLTPLGEAAQARSIPGLDT